MKHIILALALLFAMMLAANVVHAGPVVPSAVTPSVEVQPGVAKAVQVTNFIQGHADYLSSAPANKLRWVNFAAVSNRPDGVATYTEGQLKYLKNESILTGEGTQYFNNRYWSSLGIMYPFDPKKTDKLRLTLDTNSPSATLTFLSQGGIKETINLQLSNDILYGSTSTSPATMYVISLQKKETDKPR